MIRDAITEFMSFAAKFYTFSIDLNHVDRQLFTKFRIKVPLHPVEPLQHLYARMIAYLNSYSEGLLFSQGLFDQTQPTLWEKNVIGEVLRWIEVGVPDKKKLELALRLPPPINYHIYFYEHAQIPEFCHHLRGSKTNWVAPFAFSLIDPDFLENLLPYENSSPTWEVTIIDGHLYLVCDKREFDTVVLPVDIWNAYQESIQESTGKVG